MKYFFPINFPLSKEEEKKKEARTTVQLQEREIRCGNLVE